MTYKEKSKKIIDDHIKTTKGVTRSGIAGNKEKAWKELQAFEQLMRAARG